jgi:hypothetical protein
MTASMIDRNTIDQGYDKLRGLWDKTKVPNGTPDCLPDHGYGFWHAGNTLDTFMDYLGRAKPQDYKKMAAQLAEEAITVFKQTSSMGRLASTRRISSTARCRPLVGRLRLVGDFLPQGLPADR